MVNVTGQLAVTFASILAIIVATFNMNNEYRTCMTIFPDNGDASGSSDGATAGFLIGAALGYVKFRKDQKDEELKKKNSCMALLIIGGLLGCAFGAAYGAIAGKITSGASFFNMILPSLVFHPLILEKLVALLAILFSILAGFSILDGIAVNVVQIMGLFGGILAAPFLVIGLLYFLFFLAFIFGIVLYCAQSIFLGFLLVILALLFGLMTTFARSLEGKGFTIRICGFTKGFKIIPIPEGTLWWAKEENEDASSSLLIFVCASLLFLVLSPILVFGSWTALFVYLRGRANVNF